LWHQWITQIARTLLETLSRRIKNPVVSHETRVLTEKTGRIISHSASPMQHKKGTSPNANFVTKLVTRPKHALAWILIQSQQNTFLPQMPQTINDSWTLLHPIMLLVISTTYQFTQNIMALMKSCSVMVQVWLFHI
jgi:hypothetical protein